MIAAMTWTFDITLEKKKESKNRVIFPPICCLNKLLSDMNENFHEIATTKNLLQFHEKVAFVPKVEVLSIGITLKDV